MSEASARIEKVPGVDYTIRVVGGARTPLRDSYHALLRLPWPQTLGVLAAVFALTNGLFALGYMATGGVAQCPRGSFLDAFFFSVETMGTIGYGAMYPTTRAANALMVAEAITGLILTAMGTGLVFAKLSRPTARMRFTRHVAVAPMNGVPTLAFRLGNERGNRIVDAQLRAVLMRTEQLAEGGVFYRMVDLKLARDRSLSLARSWSILHPIDPDSPLYGVSPADAVAQEMEVQVLVVGLDDTTMQPVHAGHRYFAEDILWGHRHVDILSESPEGGLVLDLRRFHDTEPTRPIAGFPYPAAAGAGER